MDSTQAKYIILHELLFQRNYLAAVTEYSGRDIFAIRRTHYTVEFEIKMSRQDFRKEINVIRFCLENSSDLKISPTKYSKHYGYLNKIKTHLIPNEFNFVVCEGLEKYALDQLKDIPNYGLYVVVSPPGYIIGHLLQIKEAKKLHKNKFDDIKSLYRFFRKTSTENLLFREKLLIRNQ